MWISQGGGQRNPDACDSAKCSVSLSVDVTILPNVTNVSKGGETIWSKHVKTGKRDRDSLIVLLLKPATAPRKGTGIETA